MTDTPVFGRAFPAKPGFQSMEAWLVALLIATVFAIDGFTPLGFGIPFFYVLILWAALVWATPRQALAMAATGAALTVVGLFLSPEGHLRTDLTNRTITLFTLWFLAYFGTAYRKTIDTLHRRERELTDFVENAPVGIHWVAPDGTILGVNQEELDMLGYAREGYVGRNVIDFHVDREVAEDILAKLNANVPLKDCAARLRHKDGSTRHVLISCNGYQEDGRFIHSRCFTQDITDRVRAELAESESAQLAAANARLVEETAERGKAEQTLRERAELLRVTFDSAPAGIYMADPEGRYVKANLAYQRMVGHSEGELRGKNIFSLTHPDDLPQNHVLREELIAGKREFFQVEKRYCTRSGGLIWVRNTVSLIKDATGEPRFTVTVSQDITERKLAEQALQKSERRLRQALDEREHLSRDLHDHIIQAIYAIGMQLEVCQRLLHDSPKDTETRLAQAIGGLNGVIREVRHYISGSEPQVLSKPELGVELAKLVETISAMSTLRFRLKLDPLAAAWLTPQQAEHVLHIAREALSNAVRHSQAKHAELSLHGTDAGVRLEIRDDGVGFDPGAAGRDAGGLRNMQSRARQIGEQLETVSSPGQGTTIILHIPKENAIHDLR
ncbi:MAG: PAS domain S-box protein [Betaproteobacteria bacterium]|nr:PAS domain S-box protein [Betaproteobacteria bacterium]